MPDAREHGATVLSAIIGGGGSLRNLSFAGDRLTAEHFADGNQATLFAALCLYAAKNNGVMSAAALGDLLRDKRPGTRQKFTELYAALAQVVPEPHQLSHAVAQLQELAGERATGAALTTAALIMRGPEPVKLEDGTELLGHGDARAYLQRALAAADVAAGAEASKGGDVTAEGDEILAAYARVKEQVETGQLRAVAFGITELDSYLGGLPNGLCLAVGATSGGKSSLCVQAAHFNAVVLGLNVLFFTTEQSRDETRLKIIARHSAYLGTPLDVAKIRGGTLDAREEEALHAVAADLKSGGYGRIEVVEMPDPCTVAAMAARAEAYARWCVIPDVVYVDYLQLFEPPRRTRDSRESENQAGIAKAAHRWGQTAFGRGVPVVSPWQPNEEGAVALRGGGRFSIDSHMSQSRESGKTASVVLTVAVREEDRSRGRSVPLLIMVVKNRNGPALARFPVTADFAVSSFAGQDDGPGDDGPAYDDDDFAG